MATAAARAPHLNVEGELVCSGGIRRAKPPLALIRRLSLQVHRAIDVPARTAAQGRAGQLDQAESRGTGAARRDGAVAGHARLPPKEPLGLALEERVRGTSAVAVGPARAVWLYTFAVQFDFKII